MEVIKYLMTNFIVTLLVLGLIGPHYFKKNKKEEEKPKVETKPPMCKDCKYCSLLTRTASGDYVGKCSNENAPSIDPVAEIVSCAGFERKPYLGNEGGTGNRGIEPIIYHHGDRYYYQCSSKYSNAGGGTSLILTYVEENPPLPNQEHWVDVNGHKYSFNPR